MRDIVPFAELVGKTIRRIDGAEKDSQQVVLYCDGERFVLEHEQDCCESVLVEDVVGDPRDLIDQVVLKAEESTSQDDPLPDSESSHTWTFYHLVTRRSTLTIRWYGTSNGYYSESVDVRRIIG